MDEENTSPAGRTAAVLGLVLAVGLVAWFFFGGATDPYEVKATFLNAGQLVKGNPVQASGSPFGSVSKIVITPNGQAEVTLKIKGERAPLRQGTRATVRQASLSGIALQAG